MSFRIVYLVPRSGQAHAIPALARHLVLAAQRQPHIARGNPGRQCLIPGTPIEGSQRQVAHQHAAVSGTKLGGNRMAQFAILHPFSLPNSPDPAPTHLGAPTAQTEETMPDNANTPHEFVRGVVPAGLANREFGFDVGREALRNGVRDRREALDDRQAITNLAHDD